jgi:tetratricopeptide (TPR) repeat protein
MLLVGIIVCFGWIFSLCLHEFSHAIVAYWGGDKSVKNKGYLTFNPLKYTEPGYSLMLPIIFLLMGGIGLPGGAVYINNHRLRDRWWQSAVSAAGPISNLAIAIGLAIPFWLMSDRNDESFVFQGLAFLTYLEVFAVIFNLLPIPGLDGYGIFEPWLPQQIRSQLNYLARYTTLFIIVVFWYIPVVSRFIFEIVTAITGWLRVPPDLVSEGSALFHQPINKALTLVILLIIGWGLTNTNSAWNSLQKGHREIERGNYRSAITEFDRAIALDSNSADAWLQKGYCLWCLDDKKQAISCYETALEIDAEHQFAAISIGHLLFDLTEYRSAIPHLQHAIELAPESIESRCYLGLCWQNLDEVELANEVFNTAIEIEPTPDRENDWWFKAICLEQLGLAERAVDCYERVLKIDRHNREVGAHIGKLYVNLGRYATAVTHLKTAIASNDRDPDTHHYLGIAYRKLEELDLASAAFDRAFALDPRSVTILHAQGELFYHQRNYRSAIATYQQLVDIDPKNATGWYDLGCCQALYGNANTAIYCVSKAIELEPDELKKTAIADPDFSSIAQTDAFQKLVT